MADTVTYLVTVDPNTAQTTATAMDGGSQQQARLTPTQLDALRLFATKANAGANLATAISAINAAS